MTWRFFTLTASALILGLGSIVAVAVVAVTHGYDGVVTAAAGSGITLVVGTVLRLAYRVRRISAQEKAREADGISGRDNGRPRPDEMLARRLTDPPLPSCWLSRWVARVVPRAKGE